MNSHDDYLFKFRENLKVLNRSVATMKAYDMHVRHFLDAAKIKDVKSVTRHIIEDYIANLFESGRYTTATISIKIRAIKRFFEFLEFANVVFINPAEFIKEPKKEKRLPKEILTAKEARTILDKPNLGTLMGIRDRAVLEVFYSTGLRLGELTKLSIFDADLQGGFLRINKGKGSKDRVVPLGKHAIRFLKEYISKVRPRFTKKARTLRTLFVNRYGRPLDKQVVTIMIRTYAREAGFKKQVTAHTFRHTFACQLIRNGADIRAVQKMMGHASLRTTQEYLRRAGIELKKAHAKSHPRERDKPGEEVIKPSLKRIKGNYGRSDKITD